MRHSRCGWVILAASSVLAGVAAAGESVVVVAAGFGGARGDAAEWRALADRAAAYHKGEVLRVDEPATDGAFAALREELAARMPKFVIVVIPPDVLDVNVQRRMLKMSAGLDADPFADFAWGYITGTDAAAAGALWDRGVALHEKGLANKVWIETAVTHGTKSFTIEEGASPIEKAAGFDGPRHYFAEIGSDADVSKFVQESLPQLEGASVISMSGCGDPQGVWLFADKRNMEAAKHWKYDPLKVGQDPAGEMPRILASQFRSLKLKSPVVWSGTCHSAVPRRAYVEGDIVSTFGTSERTELYRLPERESMCLAILDAGAAAYIAPIGANHGFSAAVEQEFALTTGCTLGEAVKSTYDDVLLASHGRPRITLYEEGGKRGHGDEAIMQAGGANRILIGDPTLRPFSATPNPAERATVEAGADGVVKVKVEWDKGFHYRAWDMYTESRSQGDFRVWARVELSGPLAAALPGGKVKATVTARDGEGNVLPYRVWRVAVDEDHGRRWLVVQANVDRNVVDGKAVVAEFAVERAGE